MKSGTKFLIILSLLSFSVIIVLALIFLRKEETVEESIDEVEYTINKLKNPGFETGDLEHWQKNFRNTIKYFAFLDEIVKFEGNYSLNITSDLENTNLWIEQKIYDFPLNKKLIFNAKVRTENVNSVFLCVELLSDKDSLLAQAFSDTLKGTNDWNHLTTWVRTINPQLNYIIVKCNLIGRGRIWVDNLELYPVDIQQKYILPFNK